MNWYGITLSSEFFVLCAIFVVLGVIIYDFSHPRAIKVKKSLIARKYRRQDRLFKFGVAATASFVVAVIILYGFEYCLPSGKCQSKAIGVLSSSPNEFGDAIAGIAGALAFFWIIVTVMMQSSELKAQRMELRLTREEFQRQRVISEKQIKILKDEEVFRSEQRANMQFKKSLADFRRVVEWYGNKRIVAKELWGNEISKIPKAENDIDFFVKYYFILREVMKKPKEIRELAAKRNNIKWVELTQRANAIIELKAKLSDADKSEIKNARIPEIRRRLEALRDVFDREDAKKGTD